MIKNNMDTHIGHRPYAGPLTSYFDQVHVREFGDILSFLQRVKNKDRVFLLDILDWVWMQEVTLPTGYDIYVLCAFGEFVNNHALRKLAEDPTVDTAKIILLTSQTGVSNYSGIKVFRLEYIHSLVNFLPKREYIPLRQRQYRHGSLSHRNEEHKSFITANLKHKTSSYVYSFCNAPSDPAFDPNDFYDAAYGKLGLEVTDLEYELVNKLHNNPVMFPGVQWDIDLEPCTNAQVHWSLESVFITLDGEFDAYLTEKTFKPIITGCMFIIVGQRGSYQRLKDMGFETFEDELGIVPEYHSMHDSERLRYLVDLMDNFPDICTQELVDYNYNHFFTGFADAVKEQNNSRIESILDYIDA